MHLFYQLSVFSKTFVQGGHESVLIYKERVMWKCHKEAMKLKISGV